MPSRDSTISHRINHFRPQILLILLATLSLLFTGVRVPDLSRPHRPKLTHRLVFETQHKNFSKNLKQCDQFGTALPKLLVSSSTISYHAVPQLVPPLYATHLFPPNSGRSPPAPQS